MWHAAVDAACALLHEHPSLLVTQRTGLCFVRRVCTCAAFRVEGALSIAQGAGALRLATTALLRFPADGQLASDATALIHALSAAVQDGEPPSGHSASSSAGDGTPMPGGACGSAAVSHPVRGAAAVLDEPGALVALVQSLRLHSTRSDVQKHAALALLAAAAISDSARAHVLGLAGSRSALLSALRSVPDLLDSVNGTLSFGIIAPA